jgi:phosphoglycerate dehydrogenase-like enzyme
MQAILLGSIACEQEARLRGMLTSDVTLVPVPESTGPAEAARCLGDADMVVALHYTRRMPPAPRLRFLQVAGAGYDGIDFTYLPPQTIVSNAFGHENAVAEYVILGALLMCTRFAEAEATFRRGSWERSGRTGAPPAEELADQTLGVIGLGHVGRAVVRRARALDARVIACSRSHSQAPEGLAWVGDYDRLDHLLAESDIVVLCCALTAETMGLLDARRLRLMRRSAVLINVARGPLVDEQALFDALRDGTIGGAVLDTWYRYPTREAPHPAPSRLPFHELPNVHMTPHSSAWTTAMIERRWSSIAENLDRVARGELPRHIIVRHPGSPP